MPKPALIVLEDGATFAGEALVGHGTVGGEFVFNTSMQGYQEIVTDPSYAGQVVTFTFPMNGNYGVDPERDESDRAHARAVVARELTNYRYNRVSSGAWLEWLADHGVLAVSGVDTRALTRHLRDRGALRGVVSAGGGDVKSLRAAARGLPRMSGLDLADKVTCDAPHERLAAGRERFHVVAFDFGVKRAMLAYLAEAGMRVTVVPARTSARDVLKLAPDGVFLSNGPGDPAAVTYAVKNLQRLLGKVPVFGICLGHQLLALALGLSTYKLKFGHRGANHPVKDLRTGAIEITTQNHGFAVRDEGEERGGATVTHVNLNDGTVEGLAAPDVFAFSVQYHPESSPGPHDSLDLFERFSAEMQRFGRRA
jgi:carbamoyl-phosphate synthase small subunit